MRLHSILRSVIPFGKLITAIVFTAAVLIKILPILKLPVWVIAWVGVIALIKLVNLVIGFVRRHTLTAVHSVINKVTGALLFILPFTIPIINIRYTAPLVCIVAIVAAITESRTILKTNRTGESYEK